MNKSKAGKRVIVKGWASLYKGKLLHRIITEKKLPDDSALLKLDNPKMQKHVSCVPCTITYKLP